MKIAEIRRTIESCNWSRNDLSGSTMAEFKAQNVPARLNPHITAVRSLVIAPRYKNEIEAQAWAIKYADRVIARWAAMHSEVVAA